MVQLVLEYWKSVVGYEGLYEVSCTGVVRRVLQSPGTRAWTRIKPSFGGRKLDYLYMSLCKNGKAKPHAVHRLVSNAFLGLLPQGMSTNHIDGRKSNNRASNLEYITPHANQQHALRVGLQPRKLSDSDVRRIRILLHTLSASEIARQYNVRPITISKIKRGLIYWWLN